LKVIEAKHGGEKAFEKRVETLAVHMFGHHYVASFLGERQFDCTLTVPGEVVETNGQVLAGHRVRWEVGSEEAYPLGFHLTCRSLLEPEEVQKGLLKGQPRMDREARLAFVAMVQGSPALLEACKECRTQKKLAPLYEYRGKVLQGAANSPEVPKVRRLWEML